MSSRNEFKTPLNQSQDYSVEIKSEGTTSYPKPTDKIQKASNDDVIIDTAPEEIEDAPPCPRTQRILWLLTLIVGSGSETIQIWDGLKDIPGKLLGFIQNNRATTFITTALYFLQSITINKKFTVEGFVKMGQLATGKRIPEKEELPICDERKARVSSVLLNAYAFFSDAVSTAYYLAQTDAFKERNTLNYTISAIVSLCSLPTEGLNNYLAMNEIFSRMNKVITASLTDIKKSTYFKNANSTAQEAFNTAWTELHIPLKLALQQKENAHLFPDELSTEEQNQLASKTIAKDMIDALTKQDNNEIQAVLLKYKVDKKSVQTFMDTLQNYKPKSCCQKLTDLLCALIKFMLKFFGASQDVIASFVSVAAMFSISLSPVKFFLLFLSLANGMNDLFFNGKNSGEAIDQFRSAIAKGMPSFKTALIFALSLFSACLIGDAQKNLISVMLEDPDATLPSPLPSILPMLVNMILSWGTAFREAVNYTFYLFPIFEYIINKITPSCISSCFTSKERSTSGYNELESEEKIEKNIKIEKTSSNRCCFFRKKETTQLEPIDISIDIKPENTLQTTQVFSPTSS